jgi:hypothetical protein
MTTQEHTHDRGAQRLAAAVAERDRLTSRLEAAVGTPGESPAAAALHVADGHVMARDAWLKWVDDDGYHGLNAGPFALRSELENALGTIR